MVSRVRSILRARALGLVQRRSGVVPFLRPLYRGTRYHCPVCDGSFNRFVPSNGRRGVLCPGCGSRERHRLLWLFLDRETDLFQRRARMLHIAPEHCLARRFERLPTLEYVAGDLDPKEGERRIDVTQIPFPDDHFDVIVCFHVLEHVPDDRAAMRELRRVLRADGWGIVQVPIMFDATDEDFECTDPKERLRRFGQEDHVRVYGLDFYDRLREEGFSVDVRTYRDTLTCAERELHRLHYLFPPDFDEPPDTLWQLPVCTKAA